MSMVFEAWKDQLNVSDFLVFGIEMAVMRKP